MSRYRYRRRSGAEKIEILLAVLIALVINLAFAFMCVGLPMVVFHAPTWAWVGLTFAAVYASIDGKS
jgi:hypothetical protein